MANDKTRTKRAPGRERVKILRIPEESYTLLYFTKKNPVQKQETAT